MALQQATDIDNVHPYQNKAIAAVAKQLGGIESITVNATTQQIAMDVYQTKMTTAAASSVATLPAGAFPGQRKVITLAALGAGGQTLALTPHAGVTWKASNGTDNTVSNTFDAADEFLLVEWDGAAWATLKTTATEVDDGA